MTSKRTVVQLLERLRSAGVTHLPRVESPKPDAPGKAVGRKSPVSASGTGPDAAVRKLAAASQVEEPRPVTTSMMTAEQIQSVSACGEKTEAVLRVMSRQFDSVEERAGALATVAEAVAACQRCQELASRRKRTVFGVGNPAAEIMFIGEAPGAEEDATGEPFIGPAGQLLDRIIAASHLRREDLYVCNILRCRPPGNRNPLPQEAVNCREFLDAQIHVVQPKYIVCWGTVAAQNLLGVTEAVGKLRGRLFDYHGIRVMCTYHPSYLLRNPAAKKQVWDDMKFFMRHLGVELQ
ncbi:MAG: uracil-DNA glycosylase family protein [Planctomycetota bacterium]